MFTGIIEELGQVKSITRRGNVTALSVRAAKVMEDTKIGDSIAVNGACLTVVKKENGFISFDLLVETTKLTNLGKVNFSTRLNLERALKVGDRLSGHFVTGHIDCKGIIRRKTYSSGNLAFEIAIPAKSMGYCLPKGSIAVDGISLTIMERKPGSFTVYVIPHTLQNTTLGFKGPSDEVNIEFDILAKKGNTAL